MTRLSARSFVNIPGPDAGGLIRWNPGFYMGSGEILSTVGHTIAQAQDFIKAEMDRYLPNSRILGFHFRVAWAAIETSRGTYDWSPLDTLITYLHVNYPGKLWSVELWPVKFASNGSGVVPSYLSGETDAAGGWTTAPDGYATKANLYKASIMDRWIALNQAFATHYAADTTLSQMHTEETSFDFTAASGWSASNEIAQLSRYYDVLAAMQLSLQIPIFVEINYFVNEGQTESLVALAAAKHLGVGGPDTFGKTAYDAHPTDGNYVPWGQLVFIGKHWNGSTWVSGGTDLRGVVPAGFQVEEPELVGYQFGGQGSPWTMADIYDMSHNVIYNNYTIVSTTPTVYGTNTPAYKKSDDAVSYIQATSLVTKTAIPSIWA